MKLYHLRMMLSHKFFPILIGINQFYPAFTYLPWENWLKGPEGFTQTTLSLILYYIRGPSSRMNVSPVWTALFVVELGPMLRSTESWSY